MSLTVTQKKALILDTLLQVAKEEGALAATQKDDYHVGETMGWYRILSLALDEAEAYDLAASELDMCDYNPDDLLLANKPQQAA